MAEITTDIDFYHRLLFLQKMVFFFATYFNSEETKKNLKIFKRKNDAILMYIILVKLKNVHEFLSKLAAMPKALVRNQVIKTLFFQSDELCPAATELRHFSKRRWN